MKHAVDEQLAWKASRSVVQENTHELTINVDNINIWNLYLLDTSLFASNKWTINALVVGY